VSDPQLQDRVVAAIGDLYDVEAEIGRGGMAVVYRARDVRLRRLVAVKVLPPDLAFRPDVRQRFLREAETAAQLSHPNIVPIYSVGERDGLIYFVMGLVTGESLAALLVRESRPPVETVRRVLREVADALACAHAHGVIHRDIKPDNILIDRESGRSMVTDFGIARAAESDSRLTVTGVAMGTPTYMSPEQAMGEREIDGRSDIYSLGVVGYQMLAGEPPFRATNTPAMMMKHISETPKPLAERRPDTPAALRFAVERALAKRPEDRWPDAAVFRDALAEGAHVAAPSRESLMGAAPTVAASGGRDPSLLWGASIDVGRLNVGVMRRSGAGVDGDPAAAPLPLYPALPPGWKSRPDTREAGRQALRQWREARHEWKRQLREQRRMLRGDGALAGLPPLTLEERMRRVRGELVRTVVMSGFFFTINNLTSPRFQWWLFPAAAMLVGSVSRIGALWAEGARLRDIFTRRPRTAVADGQPAGRAPALGAGAGAAAAVSDGGASLAPPEVLVGPHGAALRRAAADHAAIRDVLARLSADERAMLPDVESTVSALLDRIGALAQSLHRLDADVSPSSLAQLDARIVAAESRGEGDADLERRLALLKRQRLTINDLAQRRETLFTQFESACLILQTIKLDLLKLGSVGVQSAFEDVTSATQEARALSRDIGHVIGAVAEVKAL
jgi:Protein kinase domain